MADKLVNTLFRGRWIIVAVCFVLALLALWQLPQLAFNFSFRQFFPPSDPDVIAFSHFTETFEYDDTAVVIATESDSLFSPEKLLAIDRFTQAAEKIDGVEKVVSLTNIRRAAWRDDSFFMERVFENMPPSSTELAAGRDYLLSNERMLGSLVSQDGRIGTIFIQIDPARNNGNEQRIPILKQIWSLVEELRPYFDKVTDGGIPVARSRYAILIHDTTVQQIPAALAVILLILALTFRHWMGVILPLSIVSLSLLYTLGVMAASGTPISVMSTLLPIIVLITGIADAVHFLTRYYEELNNGHEKTEAIRITLKHISLACLITSITTAVGFSVLVFTDIAILKEYGFFVALGVMLAYLLTITLMPSLLAILPRPSDKVAGSYFAKGPGRLVPWIRETVIRRQNLMLALGVALVLLSTAGALYVNRSMRLLEDLDDSHPIIQADRYFQDYMGGLMPFEIMLDGHEADAMKEPQNLAFMDALKQFLLKHDEVGRVLSVADFQKEINRVMHENQPAYEILPDTRELAAQYYLLYSMSEDDPNENFLSNDKRLGRVSAWVADVLSDRAFALIQQTRTFLDEHLPSSLSVRLTGTWPVAHKINRYVVNQIFFTFVLAFAVIFVLLAFEFRSLRLSLLSMLPNVFPLLVVLGVMGIDGIALKPSSAVTFSIAFGIAVDDTIHVLTRYQSEFRRDADYVAALRRTFDGTGLAVITTTVILVGGFIVPYVTSDILSNKNFSVLANSCVVAALFGDLCILTVLMLKIKPRLKTDVAESDVHQPETMELNGAK